jgi:hypothetical protein
MGNIPPNGQVAVTVRVFDGAGKVVKDDTVNIGCKSVEQAETIGEQCIEAVEDIKAKYEKKAEGGESGEGRG